VGTFVYKNNNTPNSIKIHLELQKKAIYSYVKKWQNWLTGIMRAVKEGESTMDMQER
jgi:hypothetical protein